jgi:hypothetical protein
MAFPTAVNGQITDAVAPTENETSAEQAASGEPQAKAEEPSKTGSESDAKSE